MKDKNPILISIISVVGSLIAGLIVLRLAGPVPISINQTSTEKQSAFEVTGEGSITTIPDLAQISLGFTTTKPTVKSAQEEANRIINDITKSLKDNGVEDKNIKTQNYSVRPEYNYGREGRTANGFTVSANLQVKITDFAKLNQAIDSAVSLGANQVGGITFTLSDDAQEKAEDQARKEAVDKAKTKAKSLSKASGIKLGKIINVQEHSAPRPGPVFRSLEAAAIDEGPVAEPTQIEPGSTEVNLSVTLSYETL